MLRCSAEDSAASLALFRAPESSLLDPGYAGVIERANSDSICSTVEAFARGHPRMQAGDNRTTPGRQASLRS